MYPPLIVSVGMKKVNDYQSGKSLLFFAACKAARFGLQ